MAHEDQADLDSVVSHEADRLSVSLTPLGSFTLHQTLQESALQPLFDESWTGSQVWAASILLSQYLIQRYHGLKNTIRAVELGSGPGLCGLVAARLGMEVTLTDLAVILPLIQKNVATNCKNGPRVHVEELDWANPDHFKKPAFRLPIDLIIISDCLNPIYGTTSMQLLADSITRLMTANTQVLLSYEERSHGEVWNAFADAISSSMTHECVQQDGKRSVHLLGQKSQ